MTNPSRPPPDPGDLFASAGSRILAATVSMIAPSKLRRLFRQTLAIGALLVCLVLGLVLVYLTGSQTGDEAISLGLTLAITPVPLYAAFILWLDRFEPEPPALLGLSFFLGATVSAFSAAALNTLVEIGSGATGELPMWVIASGPVIEELAKGAVVVGLFVWRKDEFDGVIDGIVYSGMVALGFAMTENIQYYGQAMFLGGSDLTTRMFVLRGLMSPFAHPLFTSLVGIAMGLARRSRNRPLQWIAPLLGIALAAAVHAAWNLSASHGGAAFKAMYYSVMVPGFCAGLLLIAFEIRREGRTLAKHLGPEVAAGVLTADDQARLGSVAGRIRSRWIGLRTGGRAGWRRSGHLHRIASELAFHRERVALGVVAEDINAAELEAGYAAQLRTLVRPAERATG